jgi:SAM-dependent methyltransferase
VTRSPPPLPTLGRVEGEGPHGWGAPLHAAVLEATAVGPATTLLDLGCGTGQFARAAIDRGARVTGIDLDPAAVARATADVPEGVFVVADAQEPPPGPFDVVAAVQLLMHVADPVAVLAAAARAGAVVAATVWGREEECDIRVFGEALAPWLGHRPPSGPSITEPTRLRAVTEQAGLDVVRVDRVVCPFDYADEEELLGSVFDSALGRAAGRRAGPVALREAVLERLAPYRTPPGGYRLENVFRVLVAHRNGSAGRP